MGGRDTHQSELFGWSNNRNVLFVDHEGPSWIVARGWSNDDRLVDIRRWRFDSERRAAGQFRRLVEEATGDPAAAVVAMERLTEWFALRSRLG